MNFYPIPQPDEIPVREREDAMGAYFMMFATMAIGLPLPILNLVAAIIYLYINKSKSKFVYFHSLQSLLSQIPTTLLNAGAVDWGIWVIFFDAPFDDLFKGYLVMTIIANIIYITYSIIAASKARKGRFYYFVFFGRLSYIASYSVRDKDSNNEGEIANKAPKL